MPDKGDSMKKNILVVIVTIFALAGVSEVAAACCPAPVVRTCKPRCERKLCVAKAKPCKKACVRPPSKCGCNAVKAEAVVVSKAVVVNQDGLDERVLGVNEDELDEEEMMAAGANDDIAFADGEEVGEFGRAGARQTTAHRAAAVAPPSTKAAPVARAAAKPTVAPPSTKAAPVVNQTAAQRTAAARQAAMSRAGEREIGGFGRGAELE